MELPTADLSRSQFNAIRTFLYQATGIRLGDGKESLVKSRLAKRLRLLGLSRFDAYLEYLKTDFSGCERRALVESLTINNTNFFREPQHFVFLRERILPRLGAADRRIRIWSAGCSSGEEPYSIAIVLREALPNVDRRDVRILATDISTKILGEARAAVYEHSELKDIAPGLITKYFTCTCAKPVRHYQVNENVRKMVRLAQLNLMADWPMKGPFDVIFCRNVMIYFEKPTQQWLVQRFWELLEPGGYLLLGHAESLMLSAFGLRYVQPATYVK